MEKDFNQMLAVLNAPAGDLLKALVLNRLGWEIEINRLPLPRGVAEDVFARAKLKEEGVKLPPIPKIPHPEPKPVLDLPPQTRISATPMRFEDVDPVRVLAPVKPTVQPVGKVEHIQHIPSSSPYALEKEQLSDDDTYITIAEAAKLLRIDVSSVYSYANKRGWRKKFAPGSKLKKVFNKHDILNKK